MTIDEVDVISLPELVAVVVLGIGLGYILHRGHHYGRTGLVIGLASGSAFFLLLVIARTVLFPEHPELAALRLYTWGLYVVFLLTIVAVITVLRR